MRILGSILVVFVDIRLRSLKGKYYKAFVVNGMCYYILVFIKVIHSFRHFIPLSLRFNSFKLLAISKTPFEHEVYRF